MKLGDVGNDVHEWRIFLEGEENAALPGDPRVFTAAVHNATVAYQKSRGLVPDGKVGPAVRAALGKPKRELLAAVRFDTRAIRYVEAASWSRDVGPVHKNLVALHCMEAAEASTTAEGCAGWFAGLRGPAPKTSAHYCLDDDSIIRCVPEDRIAWHAPGVNTRAIGIELAGYARQTRDEWFDDFSLRMLLLAAALTADICRRRAIPILFLDPVSVKNGLAGITTHANVTKAYPEKGSHTDPGPSFPIADFLRFTSDAFNSALA